MSKRNKIIYWIATVWLCFGMTVTALFQIIKHEESVLMMTNLGYPMYFLTIIGVWKILGAVALLVPKLPLLKEWTYAGFIFLLSGAIISHLAVEDEASVYFGPVLLLVLTVVSWYFRPDSKKIVQSESK